MASPHARLPLVTETLQETTLVPLVRTVFGYTDKPTLTELVEHLDGLNYIIERIKMPRSIKSGIKIPEFLRKYSRAVLETRSTESQLDYSEQLRRLRMRHMLVKKILEESREADASEGTDDPLAAIAVATRLGELAEWRVVRLSMNSPMEIVLGFASAAAGTTVALTVGANRVISVFKNWQKMKQEKSEADLRAAEARQANTEADIAVSQAKIYEAAANYLVKHLDIKPLELDARRLAHAVTALEAVSTMELLDDQSSQR